MQWVIILQHIITTKGKTQFTWIFRKFWMLNPTHDSLKFEWTRDEDDHHVALFTCDNMRGELNGGKRLLVTFTFNPQQPGKVENWWTFHMNGVNKQQKIPFLLVGRCKEPRVNTNVSYLNFKPSLAGMLRCWEIFFRLASKTVMLIKIMETLFNK